jgi:hypothetical protein
MANLLPPNIGKWQLAEPPQSFVGDELFKMIDGGAALYQEYGFDRAASAEYRDSVGHFIQAEIYIMLDSAGADGIFGVTALAGLEKVDLGDEGILGEYFLIFRKGRSVVTVSGQTSDRQMMDGVKAVGRAIDKNIGPPCMGPVVSLQFSPLVAQGSRPVFLRGPISTGNFYIFSPRNIFNVREGVTGERDSTRFFVFRYASSEECGKSFSVATEELQADSKYSNFVLDKPSASHEQRFACKDRDGNFLSVRTMGRFIIIIIGRDAVRMNEMGMRAKLALTPITGNIYWR